VAHKADRLTCGSRVGMDEMGNLPTSRTERNLKTELSSNLELDKRPQTKSTLHHTVTALYNATEVDTVYLIFVWPCIIN